MDSLDALVARNPRKIVKVANYAELVKAVKQHKMAAMFGVEGGHMIEDKLSNLDSLYKRGARYLTLTQVTKILASKDGFILLKKKIFRGKLPFNILQI